MALDIHNETPLLHGLERPLRRRSIFQEAAWLTRASVPLIGSYYLHYSFGFLNLISLGSWGREALSAYALANMTCAILAFAPATGIGSALDTLCTAAFAQSIGRTYAGLNLQRGLVAISLWFAVVLVVFQVAIPSVYMFIGQREELAMASASYLRILSFGLWPWMAFECLKRYVQANVQMRLPAMVLAVVSPLHLLNHWFFIWRQPDKASFTTVAWITVFSYWAMFLGLVACTLFYDALKPAWRPNDVKSLVATSFYLLAVPAMVEACGEYIAFELMTLLATYLGPVNLAAQAIAFSSMSMLYQLPHAVGGAAAVRIGRLLGEGDKVGARFAAIVLISSGLAYSMIGSSFFLLYGNKWIATYTSDVDVLSTASRLISIAALIEWTDATRGIVPGIFRGLGKQRQAAAINIASYYCVILPLGIVAIYVLNMGIFGLWIAFALGMSLLAGSFIYTIWTVDWESEAERSAARVLAETIY